MSVLQVHGILPPGRWGDNFIRSWRTLNFHLPLEGVEPNGGFQNSLTFFYGGGDNRGESLCHWPKFYSSLPHQSKSPLVHSSTKGSTLFSCSHCSCTIFILPLYSLYTLTILLLILINVQYLQNVVFSFDKGLSGQIHSLSDSHHPIFFSEFFHDIKGALIYKVNCNLKLP